MPGLRLVPVLHNVSSIQRLVDTARLVYSLGLGELVVTKAYGAAAQHGLAEVGRLAYKLDRSFFILPDLKDAVELVRPDRVLVVTLEHARARIDPANPPRLEGVVLVAFNGGDPDFTAQEAALGEPVYIEGVDRRLGAPAEAALTLYPILRAARGAGASNP
ncbi:RecB-family nuclease [Stetteria hydrogenophila]